MGLDMYLKKKIYIGANYSHNEVKGNIALTKRGELVKVKLNRISEIVEEVGYWRKANHIHKWFVNNVQKGKDDCGEYYVSKEQLEKLLADCKEVKKKPKIAKEVLPTTKGFFFGGTDYDEYYMVEIDNTIKIVKDLLKEISTDDDTVGDIYYQSSW